MNYAPIVKKIIDYIEINIYHSITLNDITTNFFISKFHFHRIFKVYAGISFGQYITKRRLQYIGDDILKDKNIEIWKIALNYSYTQPQILNRIFKKHYNFTPTQYRKNNIRSIIQNKLVILEKETISLNGKIMIDLSLELFKKTKVYGITYSIDLKKIPLDEEEIIAFTKERSKIFIKTPNLKKIFYISIKKNKDIYIFGFFTDKKLNFEETFIIPNGLYALLHYSGNRLYNSLDIVLKDIESVLGKEHITPKTNTLEIIQQFSVNTPTNYSIHIPIIVNK